MKYQVAFSLKKNEKVFMNVVCCSRDRLFIHKLLKKTGNGQICLCGCTCLSECLLFTYFYSILSFLICLYAMA